MDHRGGSVFYDVHRELEPAFRLDTRPASFTRAAGGSGRGRGHRAGKVLSAMAEQLAGRPQVDHPLPATSSEPLANFDPPRRQVVQLGSPAARQRRR